MGGEGVGGGGEPQITQIARTGGREGEGEPQIAQIAQMEGDESAGGKATYLLVA